MKIAEAVLSAALLVSGGLGVEILVMDKWLWYAAPTHAYGLVVFVLADLALVATLWKKTRLATLGTISVAIVQLSAMLGDIAIGQPVGIPAYAFRTYLLTDVTFTRLLVTQGVIFVLAVATLALHFAQSHKLSLLRIVKS